VLVSKAVYELVRAGSSEVTFLDGHEVELKGIAGTHRLYALSLA
jgi:class 3 adenylate cyclase